MKKVYLLPNLFTASSLLCGLLAIINVFNAYSGFGVIVDDELLKDACWLILLASLLDVLDGKIARLTHTQSAFGMHFDSLSDNIAFGVAPAILMYSLLSQTSKRIAICVCVLYAICGTLRLARFNVQAMKEEKKSFTGLPIPAAAGVLVSAFIVFHDSEYTWIFKALPILIVAIAYLMVSKVNYPSFKNLELEKRKEFEYLFTIVLVICLMVLLKNYKEYFLLVGFLGYAVYGFISHTITELKGGTVTANIKINPEKHAQSEISNTDSINKYK